MSLVFQSDCPCGSAAGYDACCGRLHRGQPAKTPEELMRSRYSAFALGDDRYLFRTWHPRTRPDEVEIDPGTRWTGLDVLGSGDDWVEFEAHYEHAGKPGTMHERSTFAQHAGRWTYLDGS